MTSLLCIIPAKGQSRRFPGKNVALLNGKPLLSYSIEVAQQSGLFQSVVVSSEDSEIEELALQAGATVHQRSTKLTRDNASLVDVSLDVIRYFENKGGHFDAFCLLQPTCPLRKTSDLQASYRILEEKSGNYVLSVTEYEEPIFWALSITSQGWLEPNWASRYENIRVDLPKVYKHNGSIVWAKVSTFVEEKTFGTGSRILPYYMSRIASVDIDHPFDLKIAELILREMEVSEII